MGVDAESPFKGASQQPTRCSYRRQVAENDVPFTMKNGKLHFLALAFTIALNGAGGREVIRTQTRPAIEFISGEEGPRPKSYYIVFSSVEYVFADALNYVKAPGSSCGAEERWRDSAAGGHSPFRDPVCSQSAPCNSIVFPLKDVFYNLPVGQLLWRPELYVPSFVRIRRVRV